jgi:hypothetical protein
MQEDMHAVEWAPTQAAVHECNWLVSDAYARANGRGSLASLDLDGDQQQGAADGNTLPPDFLAQLESMHQPQTLTPEMLAQLQQEQEEDGQQNGNGKRAGSPFGQQGVQGEGEGVEEDEDMVDWTVRGGPPERMGSPAPTPDQISEVLGGATSAEFQWAMAVGHTYVRSYTLWVQPGESFDVVWQG